MNTCSLSLSLSLSPSLSLLFLLIMITIDTVLMKFPRAFRMLNYSMAEPPGNYYTV